MVGGMHQWQSGACVVKGACVNMWKEACVVKGAMCGEGGMCRRKTCVVKGGMCGEGAMCGRRGHVWEGACMTIETATAADGTYTT